MDISNDFTKAIRKLKSLSHAKATDILDDVKTKRGNESDLIQKAEYYTKISSEVDTFCGLLFSCSSKKMMAEQCPNISEIWFGDYYDATGLVAIKKFNEELK